MNKLIRLFGLSLALVLLIAVGLVGAQDEEKVLRLNWGPSDIPSLDPSLATDVSSIQIIESITVGLTRLNEESEIEPGFATDWSISDDGLTYTFNLLQEVPWVSYDAESGEVVEVTDEDGNVRYVTAGDFVFAIQRSLSPDTASYYGGVLSGWIDGGAASYNGEGTPEDVAVTALDDYTLEITATNPASFLTNMYGMWMAVAQPSWAIEEYGDSWTEDENIQSYGPFAVSEWNNGENLNMVDNPFWPGTDSVPQPMIDRVEGVMLETSAALTNYEADRLDVSAIPLDDFDRVVADPVLSGELNIGADTCTFYFAFNSSKAPFDDVRVRQAFAMALNRQELIDNVLKRGERPAYFFSRPELVAAPQQEDYPDYTLPEDDDMAASLIQEYMDEIGDMQNFVFMTSSSEGSQRVAAAVSDMWISTLGVGDSIDIQNQEFGTFLDTTSVDETAPQIWYLGWCLDYTDANNFLYDVFHSSVLDSGIGPALYEVTTEEGMTFDELVEQAQIEQDVATRTELYAEAENLLVNEAAVLLPIYYDTSSILTKPNIDRTYAVGAAERYEKWDISN